uniref:spermidine synthase n=1 Tax=uncultured Roseibium sp. TaxID=1936171 RepID=UPI002638FF77
LKMSYFSTLRSTSIILPASAGSGLVLALAIIGCGALALYFPRETDRAGPRPSAHESTREGDQPLAWSRRLTFLGLSAIPSALTIAITAHITVDIASAPFLWVVPLALFLLTFVLAFRTRQVVRIEFLAKLLPWVAILIASSLLMGTSLRIIVSLGFNLIGFFAAALYCHSLLYKLRPSARHLTEFYLWISCGGVVGGLFAGLIAPQIFDWVAEYPLLWFLTVLVVLLHGQSSRGKTYLSIAIGAVLAFVIYQLGAHETNSGPIDVTSRAYLLLFLLLSVAVLQVKAKLAAVPVLFAAASVTALHFGTYDELVSHRSFFGITKVRHSDDGTHRIMVHGTTVHGAMRIEDLENSGPEALTYFHETGEMAAALQSIQNRMGGNITEGAIVGLGTGSFLCHRRSDEKWSVFEIDPSVIKIASDRRYFRFVSDCAPDTRMVLGDARQTLAHEVDGRFDYVLIDAFSSNAIPMHLLTREALRLYFSKISEDGLLVMHIENRKLELARVVAAIAEMEGWSLRFAKFKNNNRLANKDHVYPTQVAVLARTPEALGNLAADPD